MRGQTIKKARTLLLYVALLVGMAYSVLAVTTRPAYAACGCELFTQEVVDSICRFQCYGSQSGILISCDDSWVHIWCDTNCPVDARCD